MLSRYREERQRPDRNAQTGVLDMPRTLLLAQILPMIHSSMRTEGHHAPRFSSCMTLCGPCPQTHRREGYSCGLGGCGPGRPQLSHGGRGTAVGVLSAAHNEVLWVPWVPYKGTGLTQHAKP